MQLWCLVCIVAEELIAAIHSDIDTAEKKLEDPAMQRFARELEQKKPSIEK